MTLKKEKIEELERRMKKLGIREDQLVEKFILGSGKGGQKIQKTYSCVYLKHLPSGIEVKCQRERSRELNRFFARRRLCEKMDEIIYKEKSEKQKQIEKIRRQKRKRSKRAKEKMLEDKRRQSEKKQWRSKPGEES
ncbi:MAG: Peptide chain release factor 1 [Chlamydiae bacterium]|nr:Peptide chain release factor 1 [Chlamydiota bacterium]